jgi:hypothetical protein
MGIVIGPINIVDWETLLITKSNLKFHQMADPIRYSEAITSEKNGMRNIINRYMEAA